MLCHITLLESIRNMLPYNLKETYTIHPKAEAAEILQAEVQDHFRYEPTSKREKYADVWISPTEGLNVKTDNLCSQQNKGRLCTAEVNQWLLNYDCNLRFLFIEYTNHNGFVRVLNTKEVNIEEIEYDMCNQGRGLLQPKRTSDGKVIFRPRISREEWIDEFQIKYVDFCIKQILRFEKYAFDWCGRVIGSGTSLLQWAKARSCRITVQRQEVVIKFASEEDAKFFAEGFKSFIKE